MPIRPYAALAALLALSGISPAHAAIFCADTVTIE